MTETPEEFFSGIYQSGVWTGGSGSGSHPDNTATYRQFLQRYLCENQISSVLDVGCGDWQSSRLINWSDIDYLGIDLVASVVDANTERHGTSNIRFQRLDAISDR